MTDLAERGAVRRCDTFLWQKQRRFEYSQGLKRTTGPERAQAHVQSLVADHGVSIRSIAEASGVAATIISELNRGICTGMKVPTEKAILSVLVDDIFGRPNPRGSVPAFGARRRVQALMAIGWRHQDLDAMVGFLTSNVIHRRGEWITREKHDAVKDLYDRLWNRRGPANASSLARTARAGYAPPLAWDDDSIDDPKATPDLGAKVHVQGPAPEGAVRHSDALIENTEFLVQSGIGWATIPERLGITAHAVEKALYRANRSDLIARAKTFEDRREYVRAS